MGGQGRSSKTPILSWAPIVSPTYGHQLSISLQKHYEILEAATLASMWGAIEARKIPLRTHGRSAILFDWSGLLSARRAHLSALRRVAALLENFEVPGEGIGAFSMKKIGLGVFYGKNQSCRARRAEHYGTRVSPVP